MIKTIMPEDVYDDLECKPVDTTKENGLLHSVLKPRNCLIRDLLETAKFNEGSVGVLTANQIGYPALAMVINYVGRQGVILNPVIEKMSGQCNGYFKTITVSFFDHTGFMRSVKFRRGEAKVIQQGLKRLGVL
jgi:hypothetical protein